MKVVYQCLFAVLVTVAIVGAYARTLPAQEQKRIEQVVNTAPSLPYGWTVEFKNGEKFTGKIFFDAENIIVALYNGQKLCCPAKEVKALYSMAQGGNNGSKNGGEHR